MTAGPDKLSGRSPPPEHDKYDILPGLAAAVWVQAVTLPSDRSIMLRARQEDGREWFRICLGHDKSGRRQYEMLVLAGCA